MLVQINTDGNVGGDSALAERLEGVIQDDLERFSARLTRVEVHVGDVNSDKKTGTDDKRCMLEARLAGLRPIAVSHQAATVDLAVTGAVDQMKRLLDSTLGKLEDR